MYFIYVLWSEKLGKRYVGLTEDVPKRLHDHNAGRNRFTKGGIPWVVVYIEEFPTMSSARKRELFLKSGAGRKWLDEQFPKFSRRNR